MLKQYKVIVISLIIGVGIVICGLYCNNQVYSRKVIDAIKREDITELRTLVQSPFGNLNSKPRLWIYEVLSETNESTPLEVACKLGNPEIVKMLLENGAKVNYTHWDKSRSQGSPLMNAVSSQSDKRLQVTKLLVEYGADVNYEDVAHNDALSCLVYASFERDDTIEIIEYLEQNGMDLYKRYSTSENTLLHKACENDSFVVIQYLVKHRGFSVNVVNADGDTPLIYFLRFASSRDKNTLLFLIQEGADIETKNKEGKAAYDYAIERHPGFADLLG